MPQSAAKEAANNLLEDLKWRGQFHQVTDLEGLWGHLAEAGASPGGVRFYNGFDPTADSLTIGNLVPIMLMRRFQDAGHTPVVLQGGATGLIGDPSGKEAERSLRTREEVEGNIAAQRRIFERILDFAPDRPNRAVVVNNYDWFKGIGFIEALRDIGKHFSVNQMIARDSVKNRLDRQQGISYTEFSYMLLQAYDFLHLYKNWKQVKNERGEPLLDGPVTLQTAGADQWGNIVSGVDLIRRAEGKDPDQLEAKAQEFQAKKQPWKHDEFMQMAAEARKPLSFGYTVPLLTKADGTKFGKTESGAVWLSRTEDRPSGQPGTSPYAYFQFWLNASDEDVIKFLKIFTLLGREEIEALEAAHVQDPARREAQRVLAREATALLHGRDEAEKAEAAGQALFSGLVASLDEATLREAFAEAPSSDHPRDALAGEGVPLADLLVRTGLCQSKREARQFLGQGAVSVNGRKAEGEDAKLTTADLLHGSMIALRRGKKNWHLTRWS